MQDDVETIDDVDFSILKVIYDADQPLWKKRAHRLLNDRREELPVLGVVAVHTVGRRIDDLHNGGLLESTIIRSPDGTDHELITAFELTAEGEEAVTKKRQAYLRNIVRRDIFIDFRDENVPQPPLVQAIKDEFNLQESSADHLSNHYNSVEIASMLALYYIEIETQETLTQQERQLIRKIARGEKTADEAVDEMD